MFLGGFEGIIGVVNIAIILWLLLYTVAAIHMG